MICFVSPGGEISGLTHGDRKFNLVGKCNNVMIQLTIGFPKRISFLNWCLILSRRVFFRWASSSSLRTTMRGRYGKWRLNLCLNFKRERGNNRTRRIEYESWEKLVDFGRNRFASMGRKYSISIVNTPIACNMNLFLCLQMRIGERISSIVEEIRLLVLKLRKRDCKLFRGKIVN